jgi:hypothetical protein
MITITQNGKTQGSLKDDKDKGPQRARAPSTRREPARRSKCGANLRKADRTKAKRDGMEKMLARYTAAIE